MKKMLSLTLAVVMILGLMVPMNAFASNEITVTVNFDESLNQDQSKEITLPNLGEIKSVTSSTGSVNHSVNGDNVTLNTSGGTPSRSEQITVDTEGWLTETKTQSSQTFVDTVTKVNANGETVTLTKDGVAFVVSGSYTPADSKTVSQNQTSSTNSFSSTIPYNSGGYSGSLSKNGSMTSTQVSGSYYTSTKFVTVGGLSGNIWETDYDSGDSTFSNYFYSDEFGFSGILPVTWTRTSSRPIKEDGITI